METLVFETALGHVAFAREVALAETTSAGNWGRLLALSFGHPSEPAALQALASALSPVVRTRADSAMPGRPSICAAPSISVVRSSVYAGSDPVVERLSAFARGEAADFSDLEIETSHLTAFGYKVIAACRQIAWGATLTYGGLAKRAGRPGAARAVGSVMARNRFPLIVPCHRVVPASGGLGGFSAPQGVAMKQRLLELEQGAVLLAN